MTTTIPCTTLHRNHTAPATIPQGPAQLLHEAPCSMTARLLVPAISRDAILVTGRGLTGAEAARNLQESCAALQEAPAPTPPPSREQRLSALLTKGLVCAASKGDLDLVTRLSKAAYLVLTDAVEPGNTAGQLVVRSETHPETWYEITGKMCTCPDWERAAKKNEPRPCNHVLAVLMTAKLAVD